MQNVNVRFPDEVHKKLVDYKNREKPHMSLNALIVEAASEYVIKAEHIERIRSGEAETQYTGPITEQMAEDAR